MKKQHWKIYAWIAVALIALLMVPITVLGQDTQEPESVARGLEAAVDAGDVDAALAYYAEDAVVDFRPRNVAPGVPFEGHKEIRTWLEMNAAQNTQIDVTIDEIENGTLTASITATGDQYRQMGIESVQLTDVLVIEDGLITSQTITLSEESAAQIQAAMQAAEQPGFSNASAEGHFAATLNVGPNVAAGVGTCDLDGMGNYTCTITNNQPGETGRHQAVSNEVGSYTANADGTSTATGTRTAEDGSEMEVSYDCVTTEAEANPSGMVVTEFFCVQREAVDPTGALSTVMLSRLPDAAMSETLSETTARSTEETLQAHLQAFGTGDVDAIMAHYAEDAVAIHQEGTLTGKDEIRAYVENLVEAFPPGSTLNMEQQFVVGDTAYIIWSGESDQYTVPFASDTLIVRDGMIQRQTFVAQMEAND